MLKHPKITEERNGLPVEVGRLAEAAGEEKSAKPAMRSELPPGWKDTHVFIQRAKDQELSCPTNCDILYTTDFIRF